MGTGSCTVEDGLDQPWGQQLLQLRSSAGGSEQKALWQPEIRGLASRSGQKLEQLCTPQWRELGVGKACISAVLHAGKSKGNPSASRLVPSSSHGSLLSPFQSVLHPHHSCQNPQGLPYCHTQCSVQRRLSRLSLSSPAVVLRLHQTVFFYLTFRTYIPGFPFKSPPQALILFCWIPFWFVSLKYWGAPFLPSARVPTRWSDAVPWHTVLHLQSLDALCSLSLNSRFMQPTACSASPPNGRVDTTRVPSPELNSWFPAPPHLLPDGSCSQILVLSLTLFSHISYPACQQPVSSWNASCILPGGPTSAFTGLVQTIVLSAAPLQ